MAHSHAALTKQLSRFCCALCTVLLVLLVSMAGALSCRAAEDDSFGDMLSLTTENAESQTWNLQADKVVSLDDGAVLEASGSVFLHRGTDYLKADFARYYPSTNWVFLRGAVVVSLGKDTIHAGEAEFDLRSKTGWLKDGNIFMEGPHIYFSGQQITKHRGDRYTFQQAKITSCDPEKEAWSLSADEAVLEIDGYAQLYRPTMQVAKTDVMAAPYLILPAKKTRQAGLLLPEYGYGTKRGAYYTQPYFYPFDESSDMTAYATYMSRLGFMGSLEMRSHTTTRNKTWMMGSAISSQKRVTAPYNDPYDNNLRRTNWNRYWVRGMSEGHLGASAWRYRADVDLVSDQNYLRDFGTGAVGFDHSRLALDNMFGRSLREDDQNRVSAGMVYRDWERVGFAAGMRYEQDPRLGNGNLAHSMDETVQQAPWMDAFLYKGKVAPVLPFEVEMRARTAYMDRREGTKGGRTELHPKVTLPLDLKYLSLIGSAALRSTHYSTGRKAHTDPLQPYDADTTNPRQSGKNRTLPEFDLAAFTSASRVWLFEADQAKLAPTKENAGNSAWTGLRHEAQPRVEYKKTPRVNQERNPFYLREDRILPRDEMSYSLTNVFVRKKTDVVTVKDNEGNESQKTTSNYAQIARWKVLSGYDFEEADRNRHKDLMGRRPYMDVVSEVDLYPLDWLGYNSKTFFSLYGDGLTRHDHNISLSHERWGSVGTGLSLRTKDYDLLERIRYADRGDILFERPLRLLNNRVDLNLHKNWKISYSEYRDLRAEKLYDQDLRLTFVEQCYRFVFRTTKNDRERSYGIAVELPGFFE